MVAQHWLLFSRLPRAGATKTRLAAALGSQAALAFHAACLNDLLAEAAAWQARARAEGGAAVHLYVTPPAGAGDFAAAGVTLPPGLAPRPQTGPHLGARMHAALAEVLAASPGPAAAFLSGTDLPLLRAAHLCEAAAALAGADAVFGPTPDGGYYLVGLRRPCPALFDRTRWGDGDVLAAALRIAREEGLRAEVISPLPDGDTVADLRRIAAHPLAERLRERAALRFIRDVLGTDPALG